MNLLKIIARTLITMALLLNKIQRRGNTVASLAFVSGASHLIYIVLFYNRPVGIAIAILLASCWTLLDGAGG